MAAQNKSRCNSEVATAFGKTDSFRDSAPPLAGKGTVPCSRRDDCAYALGLLSNLSSASLLWVGCQEERGRSCIYSDRSRRQNPGLLMVLEVPLLPSRERKKKERKPRPQESMHQSDETIAPH